jgi:hypothetical protein
MATAVPPPNSQGALPQQPWDLFFFLIFFFNLGCIHGGKNFKIHHVIFEIKNQKKRFPWGVVEGCTGYWGERQQLPWLL